MSNIIQELEAEQMGKDLPEFGPGDTVVVQVKVVEGNRERLQAFEGVVIARRNRGLNSAFTVRKISHGEGVERVFQTHSHAIDFDVCDRILRRPDAIYCGLIGSLSKRRRFEKRFRAQGLQDKDLERLTCPIGVAGISGKKPAEIAVA